MIPKELVKGSLKSIVLKLLAENNRMYGYEITESKVVNNRNRIYYQLTEKGNTTAKERIKELEEFVQTIKILLNPQIGFESCGC
ncbi:MAG: hypothetical protein B6I20_10795 [Bacteroidetes bacterium 4572_117]|nr:MAG: hypothetical protein B6I20_10795 [Bacteroidetes bacterium 4572_117]